MDWQHPNNKNNPCVVQHVRKKALQRMASDDLKDFLRGVDPDYELYAQRLHEGTFTKKAELGAADKADLEALRIPKGAAGLIIQAAKGTGQTVAPPRETVRDVLQHSARNPLGQYVPWKAMSTCTTEAALVHQAARVQPWRDFDESFLPAFLAAIPEDVLNVQVRAREPFGHNFYSEETVMMAFDDQVWPVLTEVAKALGLDVKLGLPLEMLEHKPRSRSDRFCTTDLGGEEVPCVVMEGSTSHVAPSMPGYLFVDIYDASQADKDTPAGKVNCQLQQLTGAVRLDATADPTTGGVGVLFTDEMLHGVFYVEDDEEGDMQKNVPCTGPAQTRGQRYRSGSVYVTKQYRFDEGGPTAEAVLLALVAYGRDLREKDMQKTELSSLSTQQHREGRRALFMLPFLAYFKVPSRVAQWVDDLMSIH